VPIQAITSAATFGVGQSPTGILPGSHVFGFFADGKDCQIPFVLGTVASGLGHFVREQISNVADVAGTVAGSVANALEPSEASKLEKKLPDTFVAKAATLGPLFMKDLGITDYQAAGILGNLYVESGVVSDRREGAGIKKDKCWPIGTKLKGYGWAQWTNGRTATTTNLGRMDKFVNFVKDNFNGYDITKNAATDGQNYKFLIYELTSGEMKNIVGRSGGSSNNKWIGLKNTKSVEEAVVDFMKSFERPNGALAHLAERTNAARRALDAIRQASVPISGTGKPKVT
jgi:hypothetical protein